MLDLALLNQLLDSSGHVLDRYVRVWPVLVEQVNGLYSKSLQGRLRDPLDLLRPTIKTNCRMRSLLAIVFETKLCGDYHLPFVRRERFADEFLIGEGAVDLGRIKKGDAALHRSVKKGDHLLLVANGFVAKTHPHAAKPHSRNLEAAFSERACWHLCLHKFLPYSS